MRKRFCRVGLWMLLCCLVVFGRSAQIEKRVPPLTSSFVVIAKPSFVDGFRFESIFIPNNSTEPKNSSTKFQDFLKVSLSNESAVGVKNSKLWNVRPWGKDGWGEIESSQIICPSIRSFPTVRNLQFYLPCSHSCYGLTEVFKNGIGGRLSSRLALDGNQVLSFHSFHENPSTLAIDNRVCACLGSFSGDSSVLRLFLNVVQSTHSNISGYQTNYQETKSRPINIPTVWSPRLRLLAGTTSFFLGTCIGYRGTGRFRYLGWRLLGGLLFVGGGLLLLFPYGWRIV